jgi:hypothetical protein
MLSIALATLLLLLSVTLFLQKVKRPRNFPPGKLPFCLKLLSVVSNRYLRGGGSWIIPSQQQCHIDAWELYLRFQVLTAASMKMAVFWVVTLCSLVDDGGSKYL